MNIGKLIKSKNVNVTAFFNMAGPIILNGISFFTVPIFTRVLGTANYGIASLYVTWVQIFTTIIGLQTSGTISTSVVHFPREKQNPYRSSVITISCCSLAVVSALTVIFIEPIKAVTGFSTFVIALLILHSFGAFSLNFASSVFIYQKEAYKNFTFSLLTATLTVVLSLILILKVFPQENNYLGRIIGLAAPNTVIGIALAAAIVARGKTGFNKEYWKYCLPLCLPLVFHGLSQTVLSQTDKIMLKAFYGDSAVGIYSFAVTVSHILVIVWNALNNTWVPVYYDHMKAGDYGVIKKRTKNYIFLFTVLTMGFLMICPEVVKIFANEDFWQCIEYLPMLAVSSYMIFLYSFPVNFQFYYKKSLNIAVGTLFSAAVNIVLNYFLIGKFGMKGAAAATLTAYTALFIFHQLIAKYVLKEKYTFGIKTYYKSIISVAVTLVLYYLLADFWLVRWVLAVFLGVSLLYKTVKNKAIF
ncbi:MAG: oligosaccharide flippase family protein [Oscillospiraceae bacterium]|nr:oligosaccharide flippase family protein [Oscillospiraceae bacterium]